MLVHIRKYHMSKDDHVLLADMDDLDDITLDDNMDAESTGSVESGEILGPEDDGAGPDMVCLYSATSTKTYIVYSDRSTKSFCVISYGLLIESAIQKINCKIIGEIYRIMLNLIFQYAPQSWIEFQQKISSGNIELIL